MEYTTYINYHWVHILVGSTGNCQMCPCANAALTQVSSTNKNLPPHNKKKILLKVALNTISLTRNIRILSTYHRFCLVSIKIYKKRSSIYSVLIKYSCLKIEKTKVKWVHTWFLITYSCLKIDKTKVKWVHTWQVLTFLLEMFHNIFLLPGNNVCYDTLCLTVDKALVTMLIVKLIAIPK